MAQSVGMDTRGVSEQIISEVANRTNADPMDLPPLYESIDPDALEALFAPTKSGGIRFGRVEFPYAGYDVTVEFDGQPVVTVE